MLGVIYTSALALYFLPLKESTRVEPFSGDTLKVGFMSHLQIGNCDNFILLSNLKIECEFE